jgi:hypothetical protein
MTADVLEDTPAHRAILEELQRRAVSTYGEERAAESSIQAALRLAATAIWRVTQEPLEPSGDEP